jgi:hypothetical protein
VPAGKPAVQSPEIGGPTARVLQVPLVFPRRRWRPGEDALIAALRPWERRLIVEGLRRWSVRGATGALAAASLVLLVGWAVPWPESELRPWAAQLALAPLFAALFVVVWPSSRHHRAAALDRRLGLGDRLATAWAYRAGYQTIVRLQRTDAIARLSGRSPAASLTWRPSRLEVGALAATAVLTVVLLLVPSPQQAVLDRQAAEQLAVEQAAQSLEALREQAISVPSLTPEQARQLDELLRQAQAELARARTQEEANAVLAQTQNQLSETLGDPNAELRDEALSAMSETLAAEPRTQALADALQREDAQATRDAIKDIAAQADQLADVERQALSRALQRAANVGRSDPRTATALRDAAQAIASGQSPDEALSAADAALRDAMQATQAQTALNTTAQQLRDLQAQLASGAMPRPDAPLPFTTQPQAGEADSAGPQGTPIALDGSGAGLRDQSAEPGKGAGIGLAGAGGNGQPATSIQAAENVFVPGRVGNGPADQDLTDQPFTVRGAPRPYRDVLTQYAQTTRDYVDRPDISPAVRDLVKQYFQELEEGQ